MEYSGILGYGILEFILEYELNYFGIWDILDSLFWDMGYCLHPNQASFKSCKFYLKLELSIKISKFRNI